MPGLSRNAYQRNRKDTTEVEDDDDGAGTLPVGRGLRSGGPPKELSGMPSSSKDAYPRTLKRKDTTEVEKDDNGVGALPPKKRLTANRQDDDKDTVDYSDGVEDPSTDDENAD